MAKVRVEDIVDHLSSEFRRALERTLEQHGLKTDAGEFYRDFKRQIDRATSTWESVPGRFVDTD